MVSSRPDSFIPIDPATLLDLAIELAGQRTPAALRTAGDRAYYAAFLTSRDQLARKNYAVFSRGVSTHREVAAALETIEATLGITLSELRTARNDLTYRTGQVRRNPARTLALDAANVPLRDRLRERPAPGAVNPVAGNSRRSVTGKKP